MNRRIFYYGRDRAQPEMVPLKAGPLDLFFEQGDLRYIRCGDREILRRVYVAVRDRNWGTVLPRLSGLSIESESETFRIRYEIENRQAEIDFFWRGTITGTADGTIRFRMEGRARSTFLRSRIGFCVLHPMRECAGQYCRVETVEGATVESVFPRHIAPHQPFKQMRAISHRVTDNLEAEVRFEGDVFEMEDQRNWTDASFKTYCTPLELPFPVEVKTGTEISQVITLSLSGGAGERVRRTTVHGPAETLPTLAVGDTVIGKLPRIGLEQADDGRPLDQRETRLLRSLHLSHLRCEIRFDRPEWEGRLQQAGREAEALAAELELALFLNGTGEREVEEELRALRRVLDSGEYPVCTWLVYHLGEKSATGRWVEPARTVLQDYRREALFGSGSDAFFAELNRGRPRVEALDLLCYSINPQVHAFDNRSLAETLEAQGSTVESARQFSGGRPIAVSPITLKPRYNPNATGPEPVLGPGQLPPQVDPRQMSLFTAGWTLGSLKYLGQSAAYSATYYQTTGWRGVMETPAGPEKPGLFPSLPGSVFPLYHVLADVGQWRDAELLPVKSSAPLQLVGLALRRADDMRLIVANLSERTQRVKIGGMSGPAMIRFLDERTAEQAMTDAERWRADPAHQGESSEGDGTPHVLELLPYAVARIDTR